MSCTKHSQSLPNSTPDIKKIAGMLKLTTINWFAKATPSWLAKYLFAYSHLEVRLSTVHLTLDQ